MPVLLPARIIKQVAAATSERNSRLQPAVENRMVELHGASQFGKSENDIISDSDIKKLTGYAIPSKQCNKLRDAGIFFMTRPDGRPSTTWAHFNNPLSHRKSVKDHDGPEPNFGALE